MIHVKEDTETELMKAMLGQSVVNHFIKEIHFSMTTFIKLKFNTKLATLWSVTCHFTLFYRMVLLILGGVSVIKRCAVICYFLCNLSP